ncbi:DUF1766-domain-containing protein [Massarina eburnea CBS 473.64]|uniref:DUF1766-domain-containing protein n=1 Tax=Massarina eburnea CBS 473.64 TaxID=1395130 RepID=A0A6A6RWD5_9PLEO|nr:DUF1766-domain-containing protein [Massarina eburnea CBS 473.64]
MAFTGRTPESLIPRSDSRNPATTCKGITKGGRPCRRAIDAKPDGTDNGNGVLAVVSVVGDSDEEETGAAAYFCWQHKDQAEKLAAQGGGGQDTHLYSLKERGSVDTLVARLGVLDIDEPSKQQTQASADRRKKRHDQPPHKVNRPPTWNTVQGPLMSVPSELMAQHKPTTRPTAQPQRKKHSFLKSLCCGEADDEHVDDEKHHHHHHQQQQHPHAANTTNQNVDDFLKPHAQSRPNGTSSGPPQTPRPHSKASSRPAADPATPMSYIPKTLPPQLASTLLAEMAKPISQSEEEGYIYIFWLTPESLGPAPSSTASTILTPPSRPEQNRNTSDVLRQYSTKARPNTSREATTPSASNSKSTILLKIGRANNVTRRMHEWTQQCGYSLSLVRYYPYVPSGTTPGPSPNASPANSRNQSYSKNQRPGDAGRSVSEGVRKVPHAHRVERLIHLELGDMRVVKKCEACGKEHREWFEVDATSDGVKKVDEVIKRWVDWSERSVGGA